MHERRRRSSNCRASIRGRVPVIARHRRGRAPGRRIGFIDRGWSPRSPQSCSRDSGSSSRQPRRPGRTDARGISRACRADAAVRRHRSRARPMLAANRGHSRCRRARRRVTSRSRARARRQSARRGTDEPLLALARDGSQDDTLTLLWLVSDGIGRHSGPHADGNAPGGVPGRLSTSPVVRRAVRAWFRWSCRQMLRGRRVLDDAPILRAVCSRRRALLFAALAGSGRRHAC